MDLFIVFQIVLAMVLFVLVIHIWVLYFRIRKKIRSIESKTKIVEKNVFLGFSPSVLMDTTMTVRAKHMNSFSVMGKDLDIISQFLFKKMSGRLKL